MIAAICSMISARSEEDGDKNTWVLIGSEAHALSELISTDGPIPMAYISIPASLAA